MPFWEYCRIDWVVLVFDELDDQAATSLAQEGAVVLRDDDQTGGSVARGTLHFFRTQTYEPIVRLSDSVTRLGSEGWELVGFTSSRTRQGDGSSDTEAYMFKRLIQE